MNSRIFETACEQNQNLMHLFHQERWDRPVMCSHFNFEAIYDVLYVGAGEGFSEAELFSIVDLAVELMKLLQKLLLRHGTVQNNTETHTELLTAWLRREGSACDERLLRDHGAGDHQLVHQLAELTAHGLPVLQPQVHADRLLLQRLDLAADGGQVALEAAQHALHTLHREERRGTQRLVETSNTSAIQSVLSIRHCGPFSHLRSS